MMDNFATRERKHSTGPAKAQTTSATDSRPKTKEELAEIRKQMRKPLTTPVAPVKDERSELMDRLIKGEKPSVSKSEMKKLTSKNYSQLPEVLNKRAKEAELEE
jgi:hypothetical protein